MGRLLILFVFVDIAILAVALIDCLSVPAEDIRALPRPLWVLLIIVFTPLGGIAWFVAGRPVSVPAGATTGRSGAGTPGVLTAGPPGPVAPDDDPEFLRTLGASAEFTPEDAELMRRWEADLRRREKELRKDREARRKGPDDPDSPTGDPS
jgi:hypothetical protein